MTVNAKQLYEKGGKCMQAGRLAEAVEHFAASARDQPHFKTFELMGECLLAMNQPDKAVLPLAAATCLNRGVRACALLAKSFYELGVKSLASHFAILALERDSDNRLAKSILAQLADGNVTTDRSV